MPKVLPKTVYITWNQDDIDYPFLEAGETVDELAEQFTKKRVGVYKLVETKIVELEVKETAKVKAA